MGGINVGGGGHGKKSVDSEVPLVPFIDLLLCCVMFLLVTAVWNQLARINANQQQPGQASEDTPPPEEDKVKLILRVQDSGFVLATNLGDEVKVDKVNNNYDIEKLKKSLADRRKLEPTRKDIIVAPEDGVEYDIMVKAMDSVIGEGFFDMSVQDGATLR